MPTTDWNPLLRDQFDQPYWNELQAFVDGDVLYRDPLTHWAENIGTTPVQFLLVELKDPGR